VLFNVHPVAPLRFAPVLLPVAPIAAAGLKVNLNSLYVLGPVKLAVSVSG